MLTWRAPWWMYVVATVYLLTFLFNARQEAWGPANAGWVPSWPTLKVAAVMPGSPLEKEGLQAGDILEAVDSLSMGCRIGSWPERTLNEITRQIFRYAAASNTSQCSS